ncbi:MAG: hypothetical protein P8Y85_00720 [Nitrospirota bacterium]
MRLREILSHGGTEEMVKALASTGLTSLYPTQALVEIGFQRRGQGDHVSFQDDLHTILVGVLEQRAKLIPQNPVPLPVLAFLVVDLIAVPHRVEIHEFQKSAEDQTVIAVSDHALDVILEFFFHPQKGGFIDIGCGWQDHIFISVIVVRVVFGIPAGRVIGDAYCAHIDKTVG